MTDTLKSFWRWGNKSRPRLAAVAYFGGVIGSLVRQDAFGAAICGFLLAWALDSVIDANDES